MSRKTKTITLSFPHFDNALMGVAERCKPENQLYMVVKATESTEYPPSTMLKKREVDVLCEAPDCRHAHRPQGLIAMPGWSANDSLSLLTDSFRSWCAQQGLPSVDACELLARDNLTDDQRQWLERFVRLWDAAADGEKKHPC